MKRLYLFSALIIFSIATFAQSNVKLSLRYSPERTYVVKHNKTSVTTLDFAGDTTFRNKITESAGFTFPYNVTSETEFITITESGKTNASTTETPVKIVITNFQRKQSTNGQQVTLPLPKADSLFAGKLLKSGVLVIDTNTVNGNKYKRSLVGMYNSLNREIKYPDKPMNIGESFTQATPLSIPVPGAEPIKANIQVVYYLTRINDEKAYFDVTIGITADSYVSTAKTKVDGAGKGKLVYDIKENFMLNYDTSLDLNMNMALDTNTVFLLKMHNTSSTSATISHI